MNAFPNRVKFGVTTSSIVAFSRTTLSMTTLSITTLSIRKCSTRQNNPYCLCSFIKLSIAIKSIMLNVFMLSDVLLNVMAPQIFLYFLRLNKTSHNKTSFITLFITNKVDLYLVIYCSICIFNNQGILKGEVSLYH